VSTPGTYKDVEAIKEFLAIIPQGTSKPLLRKWVIYISFLNLPSRILQPLADDPLIPPGGMQETYVILLGQLTDGDLKYAPDIVKQLKLSTRVAFIGLTDSVTQANLDKLGGDFSYVFDLNKPIPGDILDTFAKAYGCS
jgi:hypothetical protein